MLKEKIVPTPEYKEDFFVEELEPVKFPEFLKQLIDEIDTEDREDELKRFKKWSKNRAFYRGNQRGFWDTRKRTWVNIDVDSLSPSEASVLVVNNQFRPQVKTLAKEFSRSQVRVRATPISDSQSAILTARFSDNLVKYYQHKLMPESIRQLEAKFLFLCGNSFRYTYYDKEMKSPKVRVKKAGNVTLPSYESGHCTKCGEETMEDVCPKCGGAVQKIEVAGEQRQAIVGHDMIKSGDFKTEVVDPVEIKVWSGAMAGHLDTTPYLRRKRIVKPEFIKTHYPFYTINTKGSFTESAVNQWQFFDTSNTAEQTNNHRGLVEYDEFWVDTARYAHAKLLEEFKYKVKRGGKWVEKTMPAGTPIKQEFPDGMYFARVGDDILCMYNENKSKKWEHIPYDINIDGFWADGMEDAVMNQQIVNEYTSLSVENVLYNASPKLIINPELINPVTVTGRPKDMILMSNNARADKEPKQAVHQLSGMNLTQEVMLGIESSKRDMREQTGALVAFNGQGDATLTTATAMSIARDSALALVSTTLAIRAEKDQSWLWQILKLVQEYWYDEKYKFLLGKYNEQEAKAFKDSDIENEINLSIEGNSWMPTTNHEKLQNLGAYLTAFGLPLGFLNPEVPDVVREYATLLYDIPFDFDELAPDRRIAQKRLDAGKEIARIQIPKAIQIASEIGKQQTPEAMQQGTDLLQGTAKIISDTMGVEEDIDDHAVFMEVYTKWLKTDEGQNAHPILRSAVKMTIADHKMWMEINTGLDATANAITDPAMMGGGAAGQPQPPQTFSPEKVADSPFGLQKPNEIQDFSQNAKKS